MMILVTVLSVAVAALLAVVYVVSARAGAVKTDARLKEAEAADLAGRCGELAATVARQQQEATALRGELTDAKMEISRLTEKVSNMKSFSETLEKEASARFKLLAGEIFEAQSKEFRQNSESRLDEILKPLKENISDFKKTVTETYVNEAKERGILSQHLKELKELNQTIGKEARGLTEALVGNTKVQGDWGEMVLETILQKSGLIEGENYYVQATQQEDGTPLLDDDKRRLRPDVVVALPDKKFIVIDSKVSLTAYVEYVNADNADDRKRLGDAHVASVRRHLKELETKKYQDVVGLSEGSRMDYVLMFIPNEHAYMTAMSLDQKLWSDAYDKRVVIISPAHVISTLRLIAQLWTRDKQTKNALKIAEEGGKLYDKFVGFVADMTDIGTAIRKSQDSYDKALNKLRDGNGNLIGRVQKLKELGARTEKMLPESGE